MTRDEALSALDCALSYCQADHAVATLDASAERATRYANNAITQNVSAETRTFTITAAFGQRTGSATTNQSDPDSLRGAVRRAEDAARAADPDLEYLPPLGPQEYPVVDAWSEATAEAGPEDRARLVAAVASRAKAAGDRAAGSVTTTALTSAIANTAGLRAYHRSTSARMLATVISGEDSGWAGVSATDIGCLPVEEIARRASEKARLARDPEEVSPQPITVVLEPQAVADMVEWLVWDSNAKAIDEGRSAFSGKEGSAVAAPIISVRSVPACAEAPGLPFAADGAPTEDVAWVEHGILNAVRTSRFWAQKTGRRRVDFPGNIVMDGSDASTEDLVARVDRGLLVTRFWYIRNVDPMTLLLTGMTRDGLYRIEGGRVVGAAVNMRFNESPLRMLANAVAAGRPVPTRDDVLAPPLLVNDFHFSSVTRF